MSENGGLQWHQTEMRKDVHGLSQAGGRFFAVTTAGMNSCDGVLKSVVSAFGAWPLRKPTATLAAAAATISLGLEIVLYWSPAMIS